jgi:hypothetical protein
MWMNWYPALMPKAFQLLRSKATPFRRIGTTNPSHVKKAAKNP